MVATYARPPPVFVQGEGSYLWDIENRKYLDFTAGIAVTSLGHSDPEFSRLMAQQVGPPISLPPPLPSVLSCLSLMAIIGARADNSFSLQI